MPMSLKMRLVAEYLKRTARATFTSPEKMRDRMSDGQAHARASAPVPHELYQVNHVVKDDIRVGDADYTVHSLVPATDAPRDTPLDICIYLHGGSYIDGTTVPQWKFVSDLTGAGLNVVLPDYGLAPDYEATEARDLLDTLYDRYSAEAAATGHRLLLAGDGAGGGLALGWLLTSSRAPQIDRVALISPWLDITCTTPGIDALIDTDPRLHPAGLRIAGESWARTVGTRDPLVTPLAATDDQLKDLPDIAVWTGTREILHADAVALDRRLDAVGTAHRTHVCEGAVHAYPLTSTPEGKTARAEVVTWLTRQNPRRD